LYSHSRGRPPDLWTFDPHHEGALLGQSPNAIATRLEHDLSSLLIFLAKADDVVLVPTLPSEAHLRTLQAAGIRLPRLLSPTRAPDYRQIGRVRAWGANSYAEERLSAWNAIAQQPLRTHPRQRTLASKAFALELFQSTFSDEERLVPRDQRGKMCTTLEDVLAAARTLPRPLLKAPLSTAGRDRIRSPQEAWISRILREQGQVVVQPQWDRILDLSLQGRIDDGRLHIDGMTRFYTDRTGRFLGVEVGRPFEAVSADLRRFCSGGWIEAALHRSAQAFAEHAIPLGFSGFFGIDAMLVHSERGPLLHPLLEVNARNTFGRWALSFRSRVGTGTPAVWRLFRREDSVPPMVPLEVRHGRWVGGHLLTSEWTDNTSVGSVLAVGSHAETLRETLLPTPETISKLVD